MKSRTFPTLDWDFPLPEPGTGVLMGNGTLGLMVWGEQKLCVTVGRNGFWERRAGSPPDFGTTFKELQRLLETGDNEGVDRLFNKDESSNESSGEKFGFTQLPCARLELTAEGWTPRSATLDYLSGTLKVQMLRADGQLASIAIQVARSSELAWIECGPELGAVKVTMVPMWEYLEPELSKHGYQPPIVWDEITRGGVCQAVPADPALTLAWQWHDRRLVLSTALGEDPREQAQSRARTSEIESIAQEAAQWWKEYWESVPRLSLPDAELQHAYLYGVFLQAGLTPPEGTAATLVGPWMEEMYLPAWGNDYHFNVNAQMIYWPCLATGRTDHLWPLWNLIETWLPQLRQLSKSFFEVEDALMIPTALDDLGHMANNTWMGMIDHGCTSWIAQLAWLHYRYNMDERVLREVAWPLLTGAFNGYWAMLEEGEVDGEPRLSLPITVSPEYGTAEGEIWGRDASFQLAALHMTTALLMQAAAIMGHEADPRWNRIREELPHYSAVEGRDVWDAQKKVSHIALWDGQDLDDSHRHHSHLAGIYPFKTIELMTPEHREVVIASLQQWIGKGSGFWSGWSLPWAASLCARCDLPDAGISWLRWWRQVYNNIGHGSDHNADFAGCTILGRGYLLPEDPNERYRPGIQLDGAMGAVTAILELLVQCRENTIVVLPRVPRRWKTFSFDGIRTEGAFLIGATVEDGLTQEIRITSLVGGPLRLRHFLGESYQLLGQLQQGDLLEIKTAPGEQLILIRAAV